MEDTELSAGVLERAGRLARGQQLVHLPDCGGRLRAGAGQRSHVGRDVRQVLRLGCARLQEVTDAVVHVEQVVVAVSDGRSETLESPFASKVASRNVPDGAWA